MVGNGVGFEWIRLNGKIYDKNLLSHKMLSSKRISEIISADAYIAVGNTDFNRNCRWTAMAMKLPSLVS